ncbi:MAG: methylmalonyl Co-A mutase-associated GTPase MeaB [Saprospiraceae bacterium]
MQNEKATYQRKPNLPDPDQLVAGILSGDMIALSRSITLIESTRPDHQEIAEQIIEKCLPFTKESYRIGITGTPGVGKSTFIEALGTKLTAKGKKVAVLAIDPSSQVSRGSILGDKTRMEQLSRDPLAFIRPSPAGDSLGGVARKTRETIILCEAAGFQHIFIETVGVGQSEITVHSMVDLFLLLLLPGAGDELQGIKRGIVEMADIVAVNKTDGERLDLAKRAKREYYNALHLFPPKESGWAPKVELCSAVENTGIEEIWEQVEQFFTTIKENNFYKTHRREQARFWLMETIKSNLLTVFFKNDAVQSSFAALEEEVLQSKKSPFKAASELLKKFLPSV